MTKRRKADRPSFLDKDDVSNWRKHWQGMPEYVSKDMMPFRSLIVHFDSQADMDEFLALVEQRVTDKTKFIWYPKKKKFVRTDKRYGDEVEA